MLKQRHEWVFYKRAKQKFLACSMLASLLLSLLPAEVYGQAVAKTGQETVKMVSLLVEDELYRQTDLKPLILRYAQDVQQTLNAQVIITELSREVSPFEIYEGLAGLYFNGLPGQANPAELVGTVLVGDLPLPVVEKGGNLWPTPYPYTDFYEPTYVWDEAQNRFVYDRGTNMAPEIWHGVIRSNQASMTARVSELEGWFEANHQLHRSNEPFTQQVFVADLIRQKRSVPEELFWRYQEWVEFAEEDQYLRHTKHWLRRLFERAEQAGISSGDLASLSENDKQELLNDILEADPNLTETEVREALDADNLEELPDNFAKAIIDNLVKRYFRLYDNWLKEVNTRVERSGRWTSTALETLPELVSQKDEASVLQLRYFNDELETALLAAVNTANVPHDVAMHHTVPVVYTEQSGDDDEQRIALQPAYWNGVRPSNAMTAEDCTLIRGSTRNTGRPFAQQVEANRSMDIDTVDSCLAAAQPGFNGDPYEGCCARNITYENKAFGYHTCDLGTAYGGGDNGLPSLFHIGSELPVFSYRGTREIEGLEGADGCNPGHAINEADFAAGRFSSLMKHDEPRPEALMDQVSAQFTRALPVDDPRGFSFLDHGETFRRVAFPNIFDLRKALDNSNELEISVRNILQNKINEINTLTTAGNTASNAKFSADGGVQFPSGYWPDIGVLAGGDEIECDFSQSVQTINSFTRKRTWTRECETFTLVTTTTTTGGGGGGRGGGGGGTVTTTTSRESGETFVHVIERFYETGTLIPSNALDTLLNRFDFDELYEALSWIDLDIEAKNLQSFEVALGQSDPYNQFFVEDNFNGYEVVQIRGEGTTEQGLEMAFAPEEFDPDFDFLQARGEEAAFVFETTNPEIEFLGENFTDTFLNGEEESLCDKIPNTTLLWPARTMCSLTATTKATTKNVSLGSNLGTTKPLEPVIEDLDASLDGKRLVLTPADIFTSSQGQDLIEVTVELHDQTGKKVETDFSSEITLDFDSSDAAKFFTVTPSQTLPVVAGKATFFLVPQKQEFGGKFNLQAVARNVNNPNQKLSSAPLPVRLGVYRLWVDPVKDSVVVGDETGVLVKVKVLDEQGFVSRDFEGENLRFTSPGGTFVGNGEAIITNGLSELTFLPNTKTGVFDITVTDPRGNIPPQSENIELLPDLAVGIKLSKKSPYLVAGSFFRPVEAELIDRYNNAVHGIPHEWTWDSRGLEIQDIAAQDADPREEGIQMIAPFKQPVQINIRPSSGAKEGKIGIFSDFLPRDAARGVAFTVIEDPVFSVTFDTDEVQAGTDGVITAQVEARTQQGELIRDDFNVSVGTEPLAKGRLPDFLELVDGKATFDFVPGNLAGQFKLRLSYPGFQTSLTEFKVLPGEAAKVDLSLPNTDTSAVDFDADKPIEIAVQVYDKYQNLVPNWGGKINLRATDSTSHLVDIKTDELTLSTGKKTIEIYPKDLSGMVRLLAEHEDLVLGTLEFKLTSFFTITDVADLAPQSLLTLLLGWEAGDLRYAQNFANQWLLQNRSGAVATLATDHSPPYQYGYIAPDGNLGPRLEGEWVSSDEFNALLHSDNKIIAQAKRFKSLTVETLTESSPTKSGLWWQPAAKAQAEGLVLHADEALWRYKGHTVLQAGLEGGLRVMDNAFKLKPTANLYRWELFRHRDYLGDLVWQFPDENLVINERFAEDGSLEVKLIDPQVFTREALVGNSTTGAYGYALFDQAKKELSTRKLGALGLSLEDESGINHLAWSPDWGVATHLAAGETIGRATQLGASDILVVFGDPSLQVRGQNSTRPRTGFTQDIGQPIFKSPGSSVRQILTTDVDDDGLKDVLSLTGNKLWVNRQQEAATDGRLRFGQSEMWLQVPGGVKASVLLDDESNAAHWSFLQLDQKSNLVRWAWANGEFAPSELTWPEEHAIESFQSARLDDDGLTDLVVVDTRHTLWRWSWLGDDTWADPVRIYDFPPAFELTDESLDEPGENLKFGYISYDGIQQDEILTDDLQTVIKTDPDARASAIAAEDLDKAFLESYFDDSIAVPGQIPFVSLEDAGFLTRADYTTQSDTETVVPGSRVEVELKLQVGTTLDRVQIMVPRDDYFTLVEGSLECRGCGGDIALRPTSQREMWWAVLPRLQAGQPATLTWELELVELKELLVSVGDFENGFDRLDDLAVPWQSGNEPVTLYFMSSKDADENPVVQPIPTKNDVFERDQASFEAKVQQEFGSGDPDGDGVPASHDHYPETANGADSITDGLLPGMLAGAIGGIAAALLQGGGSCFHQPQSKTPNMPGLGTSYKPPRAEPAGKSGGKCSTCLKNLRVYHDSNSKLVSLGPKAPYMANPAWAANSWLSTPPKQLEETCPPSGQKPNFNKLLNNSAKFTKGSLNFQIPGNINAADLNAKFETMAGEITGRLKTFNKASEWASKQFVGLNNGTARSASTISRDPNTLSYSGESGPDHTRPQGPKERAENNLKAGDTVHVTKEPVYVLVPNRKASGLKVAKTEFAKNKAGFESELGAAIPAGVPAFQEKLSGLAKSLPELAAIDPSTLKLPESDRIQAALANYETQLKSFAQSYQQECLNAENARKPGCVQAKAILAKAQTDLAALQTLKTDTLPTWEEAEAAVEGFVNDIGAKGEALVGEIGGYAESLLGVVDIRKEAEAFVQTFEENFDNIEKSREEATQKVLDVRALENEGLAATTKATETYAKVQEATEAKEAFKKVEWAVTESINKAVHEAEQAVLNKFYNWSVTFHTDVEDRSQLFGSYIADNSFIKENNFPVTKKPTYPDLKFDTANNTPGRMNVKIPQVEVVPIDMGPLDTMKSTPDIPEPSNDLAADMKTVDIKGDPTKETDELKKGVTEWETLVAKLESGNLFPTLSADGNIGGGYEGLGTIPSAPPSTEGLKSVAALDVNSIPDPVDPVEKPAMDAPKKIPKIVQPPIDFASHAPTLPVNQKPFTPPPAASQNILGQLLASAEPIFAKMSALGTVRIGAAPIPEWAGKPEAERRTGRTALDLNKDYDVAALELKPYAENFRKLVIKTQSEVAPLLDSLDKNVKDFAEGLNESLSGKADLPDIITPKGETIKSATLTPLQHWAALQRTLWQYRSWTELSPLRSWAGSLEPLKDSGIRTWMMAYRRQWDDYLAKLEHHTAEKKLAYQQLQVLAAADPIGFWEHPQVLALAPELGPHFTADDVADLNFSLEERSFKQEAINFNLPAVTPEQSQYISNPGLDLPGNNAADLLAGTANTNIGDGQLTADERATLEDAGIKPGMYYALNQELGADFLHTMPFFGEEAQASADLDGDGQTEILYTLRQRTVYMKQRPSLQPEGVPSFRLKQWPTADFLAARLPLKGSEATPFFPRLRLDVEPYEAEKIAFYEWSLRPRIDDGVTVQHGALPRAELEPAEVRLALALVTEVQGSPQVGHLSRVGLTKQTREACLALPASEIYFPDVVIRSGTKPARLWSYLYPLRGREAEEIEWELQPGEELRLKTADICLLEGEATWQQTRGAAFSNQTPLTEDSTLSDGSVINLAANDEIEVRLADNQNLTLRGPLQYHWHETENQRVPEPQQVVPLDHFMTYNSLRTWQNSEPSVSVPLTPHPGRLPWQN